MCTVRSPILLLVFSPNLPFQCSSKNITDKEIREIGTQWKKYDGRYSNATDNTLMQWGWGYGLEVKLRVGRVPRERERVKETVVYGPPKKGRVRCTG